MWCKHLEWLHHFNVLLLHYCSHLLSNVSGCFTAMWLSLIGIFTPFLLMSSRNKRGQQWQNWVWMRTLLSLCPPVRLSHRRGGGGYYSSIFIWPCVLQQAGRLRPFVSWLSVFTGLTKTINCSRVVGHTPFLLNQPRGGREKQGHGGGLKEKKVRVRWGDYRKSDNEKQILCLAEFSRRFGGVRNVCWVKTVFVCFCC